MKKTLFKGCSKTTVICRWIGAMLSQTWIENCVTFPPKIKFVGLDLLIKRAKRIADDRHNDIPKLGKLADDQHDDLAALLGASEPRGKPADDKAFGEILDSVVQELNEEQLGPSVSEQLANFVNSTLRSKLSEEKLKEKQNAYPRPQNCETLEITRVNPEIWAQLLSATRSRDTRLQKVQGLLLKGLMPLVQLLETCRQSKDSTNSMEKGKIIKLDLNETRFK